MDLTPIIDPEIARERRPDEIDLVDAVHAKLQETAPTWAGLQAWKDEPEIVTAKSASPVLARMLITRNLRSRFCACPPLPGEAIPPDTRFERMLLGEECSTQEYLTNIGDFIGPSLVKLYPAPAESKRGDVKGIIATDEFGRVGGEFGGVPGTSASDIASA